MNSIIIAPLYAGLLVGSIAVLVVALIALINAFLNYRQALGKLGVKYEELRGEWIKRDIEIDLLKANEVLLNAALDHHRQVSHNFRKSFHDVGQAFGLGDGAIATRDIIKGLLHERDALLELRLERQRIEHACEYAWYRDAWNHEGKDITPLHEHISNLVARLSAQQKTIELANKHAGQAFDTETRLGTVIVTKSRIIKRLQTTVNRLARRDKIGRAILEAVRTGIAPRRGQNTYSLLDRCSIDGFIDYIEEQVAVLRTLEPEAKRQLVVGFDVATGKDHAVARVIRLNPQTGIVKSRGCAACDRGDFQVGHALDCPNNDNHLS